MSKTYKRLGIQITEEDYYHWASRNAITGESQADIFRRGLNSPFPTEKKKGGKNGN